ncbi:MAG: hypothetical protein KUG66_01985, partial [Gammaproteobacteria bacterium]|nr:hypothetical protein [Gammaproteobacteria bacterium]
MSEVNSTNTGAGNSASSGATVGDLNDAPNNSSNNEANLALKPGLRRIPFMFAKRHGVLVSADVGHGVHEAGVLISHLPAVELQTIAEVRRFLGVPVRLEKISQQQFDERLASDYQNDSSEAMQMVEGMGDELDLASLADSVPETEDLMEQEDDAPIIRLINALLTEAVRENASDIHIETFERSLKVRMRVDGVLR